jgi:RimJ/RimL family protein N-acetyltransferase
LFHQYQEFWGQGLASGAAGAILRYAFEQLNITRLIYAIEKS